MGSRVILDSSSGLSSTAINIRKYIRETDLSDNAPLESSPSGRTSFIDNEKKNQENESMNHIIQQQAASRTKLNPISEESLNKSEVQIHEQPENLYQRKLKYLPNTEFHMNDSNLFTYGNYSNTNSIPNTFKYKSHPNAKTKLSLGNNESDIKKDSGLIVENINDTPQPIKTSTLNNQPQYDTTPDWMPPELADKWIQPSFTDMGKENDPENNDFGSSVKITKNSNVQNPNDFDFNFSSTNTMIHKSQPEQSEIPMWKKASEEYHLHKSSQQQLQKFFLFNDNNMPQQEEKMQNLNDEKKESSNNHSISSTFSTPMATMSNQNNISHGNKSQLRYLDDVLGEDGKKKIGMSSNIQNPDSPLKLFGNKYNTFTKDKLNDILAKMNIKASDLDSVRKDETQGQIEGDNHPKNRINNYINANSYTEEQFLKKADTIFSNIQKRGFKFQNGNAVSNSYTTATSTPKNDKHTSLEDMSLQDEYSSFISGFEQQSEDNQHEPPISSVQDNIEQNNIEYTSFDNDESQRLPREMVNNNSFLNKYRSDEEASYTFDEQSEDDITTGINMVNISKQGSPTYSEVDHVNEDNEDKNIRNMNSRLEELEKMMKLFYQKDLEELKQENYKLRNELQQRDFDKEVTLDYAELTEDDISQMHDFIKWKRASQLNLPKSNVDSSQDIKEKNHAVRGRVKPGVDLPIEYDNMVLDTENLKWITNNEYENQSKGSLDYIDDLFTNGGDRDSTKSIDYSKGDSGVETNIIQKPRQNKKRSGNKLEVSFHLPHAVTESVTERDGSNITHVSQLGDMTFSQIRKRLVSVITELLSNDIDFSKLSWNDVTSISLKDHGLENIKDLDSFLPNLKRLDLSNNQIMFLDGLPKKVLNLKISKNNIENITSFKSYQDLQNLDVSFNRLKNLNHFQHTIHLTKLDVSNNKITSLNGIKQLSNLTHLNVSQNELSGELNFNSFNLESLQELNLSENKISSVLSLDKLNELRILNLTENNLANISSNKHIHLKKLSLKMNNLTLIDVEPFPYLRVLRIDGNNLHTVKNLKKLKFLDELSCKSQSHSKVINCILEECLYVKKLDLSGNLESTFVKFLAKISKDEPSVPFLNLSCLTLSAMNLKYIPESFSIIFPNVTELNLNFNRISDILGLSSLKNLRKLQMVSNELKRTDVILKGLNGSRASLKVLDLRLNTCNVDLYPYVFNPQELEYTDIQKGDYATPIQLETLDDIENFAIHYQTLNKTTDEWQDRDSNFLHVLSQEAKTGKLKQRINYETLLINFFFELRKLDGGLIDKVKRKAFRKRIQEIYS